MKKLDISVENLIGSLLEISKTENVCILDSGGISYLDSHLLIAGIKPSKNIEFNFNNPQKTLQKFSEKITSENLANIFTISYDFGLKLEKIFTRQKETQTFTEPDICLNLFDVLIIHDYKSNETFLRGNEKNFEEIEDSLRQQNEFLPDNSVEISKATSNFTREEYISAINEIQEFIRSGDTYQTNLTQQFFVNLPDDLSPQEIFWRLRNSHPGSFSAFIKRKNDYVISISPERFFKVSNSVENIKSRFIVASPIKGTRPRGKNLIEDIELKNDLINSEKDRAENVMIVDLLRNDIGRICKFGSVNVEKLCELETHPTLFHLVSTIRGELNNNLDFAEIIKAVFPCGSITGAPKIRTMQIIDKIEKANRGLSMGAIGYYINGVKFGIPNLIDTNVAIRTMVIRDSKAIFNVGGGIVIDSVAEDEYEESLLKAKALLTALNAEIVK